MKKQPGFISLILIALVGFLVIGIAGITFYFGKKSSGPTATNPIVQQEVQPSLDETANWKTYTADAFQFSVKYPGNLEVSIEGYSILFGPPEQPFSAEAGADLYVTALPEKNEKAVTYLTPIESDILSFFSLEIGESLQTSDIGPEDKYSKFSLFKRLHDITVDGNKGIVMELASWPDGGTRRHIFIRKNNSIYDIGLPTYSTDEELQRFQTFVSTFKFTN